MKRLLTDILLVACAAFVSFVFTCIEFTLLGDLYTAILACFFNSTIDPIFFFAIISFIAKTILIFTRLRKRYEV